MQSVHLWDVNWGWDKYRRAIESALLLISLANRSTWSFQSGDADDAIALDADAMSIGTDGAEWYESFDTISACIRGFVGEAQSGDELRQT